MELFQALVATLSLAWPWPGSGRRKYQILLYFWIFTNTNTLQSVIQFFKVTRVSAIRDIAFPNLTYCSTLFIIYCMHITYCVKLKLQDWSVGSLPFCACYNFINWMNIDCTQTLHARHTHSVVVAPHHLSAHHGHVSMVCPQSALYLQPGHDNTRYNLGLSCISCVLQF